MNPLMVPLVIFGFAGWIMSMVITANVAHMNREIHNAGLCVAVQGTTLAVYTPTMTPSYTPSCPNGGGFVKTLTNGS